MRASSQIQGCEACQAKSAGDDSNSRSTEQHATERVRVVGSLDVMRFEVAARKEPKCCALVLDGRGTKPHLFSSDKRGLHRQ